ncbi:hypothetical protein M011DRAFT_411644 [Sporormia fimetaria CBS 119925]|uniref:Myb-like domain-containing protein n=1 Tax=Sporormia fimetaria CBS 119925 TaxID=1340428 RepID=A0A6A6UYY8_9PLEO|nr:hypothetical protein M011DRAFT_411644 [Sporormia fimetaria CBS 119925]
MDSASGREPPFAEHEKVYLLAEIIKSALPSHTLLSIIRETNIQPRWNDIALPYGRSLRSCQTAYSELNAQMPPFPTRPHLPNPLAYPGPEISKKRPLQPEATTATPLGRLIQPRPPNSYPGEYVTGPAYTLAPVGEPANKKKRGRPTKAESQARAEAAAARGEVYPPPRKGRPPLVSAEPSPREPQRPAATPPMPVPAPSLATVTPPQQQQRQQQTQAEQASDSSGKKKKNKPTPLELEKSNKAQGESQSPSGYGLGTGDASRSQAYSSFTPISAPLPSADPRDRDVRMEGVEDTQPRTTTPHSFKDTVGI